MTKTQFLNQYLIAVSISLIVAGGILTYPLFRPFSRAQYIARGPFFLVTLYVLIAAGLILLPSAVPSPFESAGLYKEWIEDYWESTLLISMIVAELVALAWGVVNIVARREMTLNLISMAVGICWIVIIALSAVTPIF